MARLSLPSRVVLVLVLAVVLTVPAMAAQPRPRVEARQGAFLTVLSELPVQIWRLLSGLWEKNGCIADPNGGSICSKGVTVGVPVQRDDGWAKNGCVIDPHGGSICSNGSIVIGADQGDNGCGADPHGGCGY